MRAADRSACAVEIHAQMWAAFRPSPSVVQPEVLLKPLTLPQLGEIRIEDAGLAIGRNEQPFASCGRIANTLSREHARIVHKDGFVYLTDLKSRKGTTVNRVRLGRAPCKLSDGDEICFAGVLSYRVAISAPSSAPHLLTLTPQSEQPDLGPIAIARFPFHIGKADAMFSKYVNEGSHSPEFDFLSRRHAYIYHKDGQAYVEDLGSANGTFVDGQRLERAVPLTEGAVVAFGGTHFVYRVSITRQAVVELAAGKARVANAPDPNLPPADEGTQFIAAPASFLRILCDDDRPKEAPASDGASVPAPLAKQPVASRRPRGRFITLLHELASLRAGGEPERAPRRGWIGAAAGVLAVLVLTVYVLNAPQRDLKNALARGARRSAARAASG